jgi:protein TonB
VATPCARAGIADVVLGVPSGERRRRLLISVLIALGAHGALWLCAQRRPQPRALARVSARASVEPARELDIEVLEPPPPPAPEERIRPLDPPRPLARPSSPTRSSPSHPTRPGPAAPAEAGSLVAQEPNADAPVDLTGDTFVTGSARAYAGGVTASNGTSRAAVSARDLDARAPPGAPASVPSGARAVSLADQTWSCPWPREADAEQIDRQAVVIRVIVNADGQVAAARVLSDPGHGFGAAAAACALRTRFAPARDPEGRPIRAPSPPIRVTFTR